MRMRYLEVPKEIWKNKNIPKETKYIYSYIYTKGFGRIITDINVGEIQQVVNIKNKGLRKSLKILEELNYLIYKEYSNGMYTVTGLSTLF